MIAVVIATVVVGVFDCRNERKLGRSLDAIAEASGAPDYESLAGARAVLLDSRAELEAREAKVVEKTAARAELEVAIEQALEVFPQLMAVIQPILGDLVDGLAATNPPDGSRVGSRRPA